MGRHQRGDLLVKARRTDSAVRPAPPRRRRAEHTPPEALIHQCSEERLGRFHLVTTLAPPIEQVYAAPIVMTSAMFGARPFREQVLERWEVVNPHVDAHGLPGVVRLDFDVPTVDAPRVVKRLVPARVRLHWQEEWESTAVARLDIESSVAGRSASAVGQRTLTPTEAGTMHRIELSLSISVPLLGRTVEPLLAGLLKDLFEEEHQVGTAYLAR